MVVFNKTIIPLALVGYEIIIANLALCASLTIYHLISNARSWNNYGLETVVSVLFSNTRTCLLYNEREIFNTARSEAECSIENFEFIVQ